MLTLKEVRELVHPTEKTRGKTPSARMLLSGISPVLVKEMIGQDSDVTVFENGYVLYRIGKRCAVFPLPEKGSYFYESVKSGSILQADFFENENWYVRLMMEGEDRIADNQRKRDSKAQLVSYSAFEDDQGKDLEDKKQDILSSLVKKEMLEEFLGMMTEKQKAAVYRYYVECMSQIEIAEIMGITQQTVSFLIRSGINTLRKAYASGFDF